MFVFNLQHLIEPDEGLQDVSCRSIIELLFFVMQSLRKCSALDSSFAQNTRIDRQRSFVAVLHELGQVEKRLRHFRYVL